LHAVLVTELVGQVLAHDVVEQRPQTRRDALFRLARLLLLGCRLLGGSLVLGSLGLFGPGGCLRGPVCARRPCWLAGLFFLVSHRSRLLNAWRCAPACRQAWP